jgi:hypothetical protein
VNSGESAISFEVGGSRRGSPGRAEKCGCVVSISSNHVRHGQENHGARSKLL